MAEEKLYMGVDVGGTHVSAAIVNGQTGEIDGVKDIGRYASENNRDEDLSKSIKTVWLNRKNILWGDYFSWN
jgi:predicted NBD/HSP70 family sugar kinase